MKKRANVAAQELLLATRSSIATITRGFPDSSLPQVDVHDNLYASCGVKGWGDGVTLVHAHGDGGG